MAAVTTFYLEMTSPGELKEKPEARGLVVAEAKVKQFQLNQFLYRFVGEAWQWRDKLSWSDERWREYSESTNLRTWVAYSQGSPAGYYELQLQENGNCEIVYFGLASKFIGKGFGGYLLSHAVKSAWSWQGVKRVWLHTCTLDHPGALRNYMSRGFKLYKEEASHG